MFRLAHLITQSNVFVWTSSSLFGFWIHVFIVVCCRLRQVWSDASVGVRWWLLSWVDHLVVIRWSLWLIRRALDLRVVRVVVEGRRSLCRQGAVSLLSGVWFIPYRWLCCHTSYVHTIVLHHYIHLLCESGLNRVWKKRLFTITLSNIVDS